VSTGLAQPNCFAGTRTLLSARQREEYGYSGKSPSEVARSAPTIANVVVRLRHSCGEPTLDRPADGLHAVISRKAIGLARLQKGVDDRSPVDPAPGHHAPHTKRDGIGKIVSTTGLRRGEFLRIPRESNLGICGVP
jgi:hypothetical protein